MVVDGDGTGGGCREEAHDSNRILARSLTTERRRSNSFVRSFVFGGSLRLQPCLAS